MESLIAILKHGKAFLYMEQEVPDFTKKDNFNLVIMGPDSIFRIPFNFAIALNFYLSGLVFINVQFPLRP